MKFNVVRVWKDEIYRQSLSHEEMDMLPANPAGELELTDASLQSIYGTGGGGGAPLAAAPAPVPVPVPGPVGLVPGGAAGSSGAFASRANFHSLALRCNEAVFSVSFIEGFNVLSPVNVFCIGNAV